VDSLVVALEQSSAWRADLRTSKVLDRLFQSVERQRDAGSDLRGVAAAVPEGVAATRAVRNRCALLEPRLLDLPPIVLAGRGCVERSAQQHNSDPDRPPPEGTHAGHATKAAERLRNN